MGESQEASANMGTFLWVMNLPSSQPALGLCPFSCSIHVSLTHLCALSVYAYVHVEARDQTPVIPQSRYTLSFKTGCLTEPRAHQLG